MKKSEALGFRFHTGSIKRQIRDSELYRAERFRFHTGSIKRFTQNESVVVKRNEFRFHTGSIKRPQSFSLMKLSGTVSIPYWFD